MTLAARLRETLTRRGATRPAIDPDRVLLDIPSRTDARERAGSYAEGTVQLREVTVSIAGGGIDWTDHGGRGRSFQRVLHAHLAVRDLAVLAEEGDKGAARLAMQLVRSWATSNGAGDQMAWHDETTAQRLLSWTALDAALRSVGWPAGELDELTQLCLGHARKLLQPGFHTTGTNHGMFQDRAILAWVHSTAGARSPIAVEASETASRRLVEYLTASVLPDGVHREHSPAYHQLVAAQVGRYAKFFATVGENQAARTLTDLYAAMARYATHAIQPDGTFPLIGDTFTANHPAPQLFPNDRRYLFAASAGRDGEPPQQTSAFFLDAGYAISRDRWVDADTFLHFSAAYHTNYHKHADDLSLWIYHRGELLTEVGPNGYEYDDPFTQLGFGAEGHNVVLVDGKGVPRVDGNTDGVGLTTAEDDGKVATFVGRTSRLPGGVHERRVRYDREAATVVVTDEIQTRRQRDATLLWHVAPGVDIELTDSFLKLRRHGRSVAELSCVAARAAIVPEILRADPDAHAGWRLGGGDPTPSTTLRFRIRGRQIQFTTTIALL